jgi:hypothetical protein
MGRSIFIIIYSTVTIIIPSEIDGIPVTVG